MRASLLALRTSRKGPGSWSEPVLLHSNHRMRDGGSGRGDPARAGTSSTASSALPAGASSAFYDGADNATRHFPSGPGALGGGWGGAAQDPAQYSWRADPSRNRPPPHMHPSAATGLRGNGGGSMPQTAKRVETAAPPLGEAGGSGGGGGGGAGVNWLGGQVSGAVHDTQERASVQHAFGYGDFSMVDRQSLTITRLARLLLDATLKPRDADSRAFGGDGATKLAEQREELKTMDQRIVPFQHDDVMNDYLKNVDRLHSPSGALCQREVLKGRLVGLLFFTESERSLTFMRHLQPFHKRHSPDLVIVAISLAAKEMMDVTRSFGFFHCTHRDGASWVSRDAGLMMRPLTALPRLVIVQGTSGVEVTRGGVTAVMANPDTCFEAWRRGDCGFRYRDRLKSVYL
ncbi:hypothetical protein NESM_000848400 [Novymonas esmeraldas]|uniref:Thioredoxin-like fold domain-containing protein n=1 Tax=Novymonas esmeraldas TaxID=1808958 RepID=A0AAW0EX15_9TRYP